MTSVRDPEYKQIHSVILAVKECVLANSDYGIRIAGSYDGVDYNNKFKIDDFSDVMIEFEKSDPLENTDTVSFPSPILILRTGEDDSRRIPSIVNKDVFVEFQIIINAKPQGRLKLEGFISLIRAFCNPKREFKTWSKYGLVPRRIQESKTYNGGEIAEKLQNRILLKSVLVTFDYLGVNRL